MSYQIPSEVCPEVIEGLRTGSSNLAQTNERVELPIKILLVFLQIRIDHIQPINLLQVGRNKLVQDTVRKA
jgi:hypothetical protein